MAWVILLVCCPAWVSAQNLLEDPSFEAGKDRDRWGLVFSAWAGNIYTPPAQFEVSPIARTGESSCLMVTDGGKIRIFSPEKAWPAGRYRFTAYIRGVDVSGGPYNQPIDFCAADGKFHIIKKSGNFGWTPVTHVVDIAEGTKGRLFVGLLNGGRLWVDDAAIEKVDATVPLTPAPVVGEEERSLAPPAPLADDATHCQSCGFRNNVSARECWVCGGTPRPATRKAGEPVKIIADFEQSAAPFTGGRHVIDNPIEGRGSVATLGQWIKLERPQDWSQYDYLKFDVFNPGETPAQLILEIRDAQTREYWTRVNHNITVPPGKSTAVVRTDLYVGEKSRPGRALLRDQITGVFIGGGPENLTIDNVRLEQFDSTVAQFPGLVAMDFGPLDSPVMEAFRQMTRMPQYHPQRGYGWLPGADFWRPFNAYQPDALFQDFICVRKGTLRVDVPSGRYRVWMNIDSPGGFWGENQTFNQRKVTANGQVVVDEKLDYESFMAHHWRNAGREDLPGVDAFEQYVQPMFKFKQFEVETRDGAIEIGFLGDSWANSLSAMVIYPAEKAAEGQRFLDWVTERRRSQFEEYFKQVLPRKSPAPQTGYVLFARSAGRVINAYDGPAEGEKISEAGLSLTIAQGEEAPLTFALQPSAAELGEIDLKVSAFTNEQGQVLDSSALQPGWLDYRISRLAMDGSSYTVRPRYWHPTPAPAAAGVTRRFWIRVRTAPQTHPGVYRGQITVAPQSGEASTVPVTIRVLPFALDPITDVAVGPWGCDISSGWIGEDPKTRQWSKVMLEKSLDVLRAAGCTSLSGVPAIQVSAANGKVQLDTRVADEQMDLLRAKGFTQLVSSYGSAARLPYQLYGTATGPDEEAAIRAGFADMQSFLTAIYSAIDEHAKSRNWLPVAWNLCDEPLGDAIKAAALNARAHRAILPGLERTTFMGATSFSGNDPKDPHMELARALPMPSLNIHDAASLKVIADAGNRFSFYNGGNRWTYGRYMKALVEKHQLALRLTWHFNIVAGDPYYALDCREDDYCWFNTDLEQRMVPSTQFLTQILPGLNDYRYISTLQRLVKERPDHPSAAAGRELLAELVDLEAGKDRSADSEELAGDTIVRMEKDRERTLVAIEAMMK